MLILTYILYNGNTAISAVFKRKKRMKKNKKTLSALTMQQYGINSVILFNHSELEELIEEYENTNDAVWCGGRGKKYMFELIKKNLTKEDKYFNKHKNQAVIGNDRWENFCNDCLILTALGAHLYDNNIILMHPQSYAENFPTSAVRSTNGAMPTLMNDIPILQ